MMFVKHKILFGSLMLLLVAACGDVDKSDLVKFVNETYRDEKPEIEPLPPIAPYEEFIYSADELPDPFSRNNVLSGNANDTEGNGLDENRRREPLEAFPLDGLRLDGVLEFKGKLSAIIKSPDGDAVPVFVGNYIGQNNGVILSINSDEQVIEIEELVRGVSGNWVKRIVKMTGESGESAN